jgi:hypothetical protein
MTTANPYDEHDEPNLFAPERKNVRVYNGIRKQVKNVAR